MDCITLKGIELWTHIGVPETERAKPQRLLVDIELFGPLHSIAANDDLTNGTDYATVTSAIIALGKTERKTVERFAEDAASLILKEFKPESVKVSAWKKPDLPLEAVCITIIRP